MKSASALCSIIFMLASLCEGVKVVNNEARSDHLLTSAPHVQLPTEAASGAIVRVHTVWNWIMDTFRKRADPCTEVLLMEVTPDSCKFVFSPRNKVALSASWKMCSTTVLPASQAVGFCGRDDNGDSHSVHFLLPNNCERPTVDGAEVFDGGVKFSMARRMPGKPRPLGPCDVQTKTSPFIRMARVEVSVVAGNVVTVAKQRYSYTVNGANTIYTCPFIDELQAVMVPSGCEGPRSVSFDVLEETVVLHFGKKWTPNAADDQITKIAAEEYPFVFSPNPRRKFDPLALNMEKG